MISLIQIEFRHYNPPDHIIQIPQRPHRKGGTMQISDAIRTFRTQQIATLRQSTQVHYIALLDHLQKHFSEREVESITAGEVGQFLESQTANKAKSTRRLIYAQVKAFFNFLINECLMDIKNPCSHPLIARQYKNPKPEVREILDKELVDQLIYSAKSNRIDSSLSRSPMRVKNRRGAQTSCCRCL
jgi:integrase